MKNIVLVGFMGTGKTKVAKAIARSLGMEYVSTDDIVENREKTTISDIFTNKGEAYFRDLEKKAVREAARMENVVIDTGGGVVIDPENVKLLKANGIMVCLWAEPEVILERTKSYRHRPLLLVEDPLVKIKGLLESRKKYYERADHHINTSSIGIGDIVREIEDIAKGSS